MAQTNFEQLGDQQQPQRFHANSQKHLSSAYQFVSRSKTEGKMIIKKIKRLSSLKQLQRDKQSSNVQPQHRKQPNYMKPTTSSDAKREHTQVNLHSSTTSTTTHDKSGTLKKFKNSSRKPAKTLARTASLVPRQFSSKKTLRFAEPSSSILHSCSEPAKQLSRNVSFVVKRRPSFKKRLSFLETFTSVINEEENLVPTETLTKRIIPNQAKTLQRKASLLIRIFSMKKRESVCKPSTSVNSSSNPAKNLARNATLKLKQPSMKKRVGIAFYGKKNVTKATCSSTLKEVEFQKALNLDPIDPAVERNSLMKVCHFCYCSLNGHRHDHSSTLRRSLSVKRRTLKTQQSVKLKKQLTIRNKSFRRGKMEINTLRTQKSIKLTRQLTKRSRNLRGNNIEIISRKNFHRKNSKIPFLMEELSDQSKTAKPEKSFLESASYNRSSIRGILETDTFRILGSSSPIEDDQTSDFTFEYTDDDLNLLDSDDRKDFFPDFVKEHYGTWDHEFGISKQTASPGAQELPEEQAADESDHLNCKENIHKIRECNNQDFKTFAEQANHASLDEAENEALEVNGGSADEHQLCYQVEKSSKITDCSYKIPVTFVSEQEVHSKDSGHIMVIEDISTLQRIVDIPHTTEGSEESTYHMTIVDRSAISAGAIVSELFTDRTLEYTMTKRPKHDQIEATKITNYRPPNFLLEKSDSDDEHVDLRHQMMDERKDAEAWMTDHALQEMVTMLVPVRTLKVPMLVEAYEVVMPAPNISNSESTPGTSVSDFAAQVQTCS